MMSGRGRGSKGRRSSKKGVEKKLRKREGECEKRG